MAKEKEVIFQQQGTKSFVKVRMDWANINKIHLSFVSHEGESNNFKQVCSIEGALKTGGAGKEDALYFAEAILSGRMDALRAKALEKQKASGAKYAEAIFTSNGGSPAKGEKPCKWRVVTLAPGFRTDYVLSVVEAEGEVNQKGGYTKKSGSEETRISVGMSGEELISMASAIKMGWQAYLSNPEAFVRRDQQNAKPVVPVASGYNVYAVYDTLGEVFEITTSPEVAVRLLQENISLLRKMDKGYKRKDNQEYESAKNAILGDCDEIPGVTLYAEQDSADTCKVLVVRRKPRI